MTTRHFPLLVSLVALTALTACGTKSPPTPAAPPAEPAPVEVAPAEEAAVEPPEADAPPANNINLNLSLVRASGETVAGHLVRLERSVDFYAEEGWTTNEADLQLSLETDMALKKAPWTEVDTISIEQSPLEDASCFYDSDYTPPMYQCILKTTPTVTLKDGSQFTTTMRHRWRLTLESGDVVELHLYKVPEREQTTKTDEEDYALYESLQERLGATAAEAPVLLTLTTP